MKTLISTLAILAATTAGAFAGDWGDTKPFNIYKFENGQFVVIDNPTQAQIDAHIQGMNNNDDKRTQSDKDMDEAPVDKPAAPESVATEAPATEAPATEAPAESSPESSGPPAGTNGGPGSGNLDEALN